MCRMVCNGVVRCDASAIVAEVLVVGRYDGVRKDCVMVWCCAVCKIGAGVVQCKSLHVMSSFASFLNLCLPKISCQNSIS